MRNFILTLLSVLLVLTACKQEDTELEASEIPKNVVEALNAKFSDAQNVEWSKGDDAYEANFVLNGNEYEVEISIEGGLEDVELEVETNQTPQEILDFIAANYPKGEITEVDKHVGSDVYYEIEIALDGEEIELAFDESGKLLEFEAD